MGMAQKDPVQSAPSAPVGEPDGSRAVTVVVPTFREAANLPALVARLDAVRRSAGLRLQVLLMDDDSRDGSADVVAGLGHPWVQLVTRLTDRGLSQAVIDGLGRSTEPVIVVMDADLSHPPEKIPELLAALDAGADFVIGSRYVGDASIDTEWTLFRRVNSLAATALARPFTAAKDPLSGFFAFRRAALANAAPLNPTGYKIGLELIVKCGFRRVREVPIHFAERAAGESKLTLRQQMLYIKHIGRLAAFRLRGGPATRGA